MTIEKSKRRTNAVSGFVNFPVGDPALPSTKEGGMFVRLVVVDTEAKKDFYSRWMCCCGGTQSFHFDESYIRDDASLSKEIPAEPAEIIDDSYQETLDDFTNQSFHFPWTQDRENAHQYESIQYLCVLTIGSTGWSNTEWTCTFNDLTDKGKQLYRLLQELYPGGTIYLLTWLDT